jgi:hypothetical protein
LKVAPIARKFPTIDVDFGPDRGFNFGVGVGMTTATDHLIVKCIIGRRFSWTRARHPAN